MRTDFIKCGNLPFERNDAINAGVTSNEQGAPGGGHMLRRITFTSPGTGEELVFLTNLPTNIPPGVIGQLYFLRWRIAKSFDVFKNKLHERKSWAKAEGAKETHASFLVLADNLGWLLHRKLEIEENLENRANEKKRLRRHEELEWNAKTLDLIVPKLRQEAQAVTQLSVKYWRWIKSQLRIPTSWDEALSSLRAVYANF